MKKKKPKLESILRRLRRLKHEDYDYIPEHDLKPGDRVSMAWTDGFSTTGYVLQRTKVGVSVYFPLHQKAKKIRFFPHDMIDEYNRLSKDIIGTLKKIVEG